MILMPELLAKIMAHLFSKVLSSCGPMGRQSLAVLPNFYITNKKGENTSHKLNMTYLNLVPFKLVTGGLRGTHKGPTPA